MTQHCLTPEGMNIPKSSLKAVIFDLDGVITDTAHVHALSWEKMFNEFLKADAEAHDKPYLPFDRRDDYLNYVDGKPRYEGVKSFLESRGIHLPYGDPADPPSHDSITGLGNKKNLLFQEVLHQEGPQVYESSVALIHQLKARGIHVAVASSSRNCRLILQLAKLEDLFETVVDGVVSHELGLKGKPEPDIFVEAARRVGVTPGEAVVVEDAIAGVQAGKSGNFGLVLGVARATRGELLFRFGADVVVQDLGETSLEKLDAWFDTGIAQEAWTLCYLGHDPGDEKLRETLTTVGNGYMAARGALETESASFNYYPGVYIAGMFNKAPTTVHGRELWNNDLVNCPNWSLVEFSVNGGEYVSPLSLEVLSYFHQLDMRRGRVERTIVCKDNVGRITRVRTRRFVSMDHKHLCALTLELTPVNYSETVTIRSSLDGNVINDGVPRYRELTSRHLSWIDGGPTDDGLFLHVRTIHSRYEIALYAKNTLRLDGQPLEARRKVSVDKSKVCETLSFTTQENTTYTLEKVVSVATSLDSPAEPPCQAAARYLSQAGSFAELFAAHVKRWEELWARADIAIEGDRFAQKVMRLHIYHLLVTASPHNLGIDAGMPARGLHGEAYRGHIFWDELYILPFFFLNFPDIAKALILYRYNRLDAARDYARENGYLGAMYPWQTADTGEEETQELHYNPENSSWGPDLSRRQRHVSIAVFYNVWKYVEITQDTEFLHQYGAEMLLEIARFWASSARPDSSGETFHIAGVMGPDEFHEKLPGCDEPGIKDNAYTNILVVWLLQKTLALLQDLPKDVLARITEKIGFEDQETAKWEQITRKLNVILTDEGVISQFDGYMDLQELDWDYYRRRYYSIGRMDRILKANNDSPDNYKVAKQADTLMTYYVLDMEEVGQILSQLGHPISDPKELLRKNYEYYAARTSHGSTLSRVVHAVVASYIHTPDVVWDWFMDAMRSDIFDTQGGTTVEGVHTGVMAGTYSIITRFFAGLHYDRGLVEVSPQLPAHWKSLAFRVQFHGAWYHFLITHQEVAVRLECETSDSLPLHIGNEEIYLQPGETRVIPLG